MSLIKSWYCSIAALVSFLFMVCACNREEVGSAMATDAESMDPFYGVKRAEAGMQTLQHAMLTMRLSDMDKQFCHFIQLLY